LTRTPSDAVLNLREISVRNSAPARQQREAVHTTARCVEPSTGGPNNKHVANGDGYPALHALYQETAIDRYKVANGMMTTSNLEKNRVFLRYLSPGMTSGYPKYKTFPYYNSSPKSAASGVRG
jgi:hypothetical protein